jgi:cytidylate kinase
MRIPNTIAIDGPAASGKSTIGEKLAAELGYLYFDTGLMYRAVTLAALNQGLALDDEAGVTLLAQQVDIDVQPPSKPDGRSADVLLNGVDVTWEIRGKEVDSSVSQVSAYAGVRAAMTEQQRRVGHRGKVVMVGRDIGTVVLPDAELKVYLDASVEERARRRYREQVQRGERVAYEEILASLQRRDRIDSTRAVAPLRAAEDAVLLKTDDLEIEQVLERIKGFFRMGKVPVNAA